MKKLEDRFWAKVNKTDGCWQWTARLSRLGYGYFRVSHAQNMQLAHRIAYELSVGPVPPGLELDHLCRNRSCVNPSHLEPVTRQVNVLRGTSPAAIHAAQTHCINGHPFDEENTYRRPSKPDRRDCRTCIRASNARRKPRRVRTGGVS